jgi:hypothetical protein
VVDRGYEREFVVLIAMNVQIDLYRIAETLASLFRPRQWKKLGSTERLARPWY